MTVASMLHPVLAVALAPLLPGVINRTKAVFAGRRGPPLLQGYFDLWKLFRKGATYSRTTTWIFRAGPIVNFACLLAALAVVPLGRVAAPLAFAGDWILLAYLLGLGRFFTVIAALDVGSSFEGMGASREVQFATFAEPALLVGLAALARQAQDLSLTGMYAGLSAAAWSQALPLLALVAAGFFVLYLAENCRIPVDDPNTHLELTMIHEVMVLDHGSVDFGFVQWGAALKLWVLGALVVGLFPPGPLGHPLADLAAGLAGLLLLAVATGVAESSMARVRLLRVPQLLVGAGVLCALGLLLTFR
ncbi:MAG: respiratory chain complex I subunit 1 family protein [Kiritimatiellia bacterium]